MEQVEARVETDSILQFDEAWYLETYEDVAAAVKRGDWPSGYMHYCIVGRAKGREGAPPIDEEWYRATYPLAVLEIDNGKARGPRDHYYRIGRHRGYLPGPRAPRSSNPACFRSRFGGLWTDLSNAMDIIEGRLDLGTISERQAEMLRKWVTNGYIVIENAIPESILSSALADMDKAYAGAFPLLKFQIHGVGVNQSWIPEAQQNATKALDLHWFSEPIRDLIFAPKIVEFLHLIFERRALASQTLAFWRGSAQDGHQDSAYVNYSLPMQFAASWIALEDVKTGAGELFYHVGSHRMAEHLYLGKFKGVEEAFRAEVGVNGLNEEIKTHIDRIASQVAGMDLKTEQLHAKRGDALFWSADLAHGGRPISSTQTRKSVVTHYCPAEVVPSYLENKPGASILSHRGIGSYSTSHYRDH
jgi:hypothetical protein